MTLTLSPQMKIVSLAGLLAALALTVGMFALKPGSASSSAAVKVIKPLHPVAKHHLLSPSTLKLTRPVKKPVATKPTAVHKPAALQPSVAPDGLPPAVANALATHQVVVVSLYNPQAEVDAASLGEAAAGAKLAHVAFVSLNVLSQKQVEALTEKLGVLQDPTLLIYRQPAELVLRIDGFADRDTVAQAAQNALAAAPVLSSSAAPAPPQPAPAKK